MQYLSSSFPSLQPARANKSVVSIERGPQYPAILTEQTWQRIYPVRKTTYLLRDQRGKVQVAACSQSECMIRFVLTGEEEQWVFHYFIISSFFF